MAIRDFGSRVTVLKHRRLNKVFVLGSMIESDESGAPAGSFLLSQNAVSYRPHGKTFDIRHMSVVSVMEYSDGMRYIDEHYRNQPKRLSLPRH